MAWYLRKAFKFGPLRINLSKSGLGYSLGVKGARIGTGPRGNYVHLGRYGVYYKQYLPASPDATPAIPPPVESSAGAVTEISSASAFQLRESSAEALLQEIREKRAKIAWAPTVLLLSLFALVLGFVEGIPVWGTGALVVAAGVAWPILAAHDRARKTIELKYELDEEAKQKYSVLTNGLGALARCHRIWRVVSERGVLDPKYMAGAGRLLEKRRATMVRASPKWVSTDVDVWQLVLGNQTLYFFPDRILISEGSGLGAVEYKELQIKADETRFIENSGVPPDAQVVGRTWRYTNRDGAPDRRFSYNPTIPIVLYAAIQLRSSTGMNLVLQASNVANAKQFVSALA